MGSEAWVSGQHIGAIVVLWPASGWLPGLSLLGEQPQIFMMESKSYDWQGVTLEGSFPSLSLRLLFKIVVNSFSRVALKPA